MAAGVPPAPANPLAHLIVPEGGDPRVRVSWDAPDASVSGYTITRADGQAFQAAGTATTFSDHSVEPGTSYTYAVMAQNAQGSSASSASASASVPDAPSQPGELNATISPIDAADEAATVTLSWQPSSVPGAAECETQYPLDGYTILRSEDGQETEIASPGNEVSSLTDQNAAFGTTYTYRVMARNAIGNSQAAEATVSVPNPPVLPATELTASIADPFDGNVSLSWDAPTEGAHVVGYLVIRYLGEDPYQGTDLPTTLDEMATQTTLVDDTAQVGVTYSYLVLARSADNVSEPSNTAVIEAPAQPSGLTATVGDDAIDLRWSAPTAGTVVEYRVERQQQDGEWSALADVTGTSHSDGTAQPNVEYRYRVQHRNQHGGSTWTESEPVTLVTVPGQPTGLTAAVDGNDNLLSWTAPDHPFVDGHRVRHRTDGGEWNTIASDLAGDAAGYRHVSAPADVTNEYAVQAYNSRGNGPWSDPASATRITPPAVPQNVAASVDGDDILVTWTRPGTVHVSGYTVRHQAGDGTPVDSGRLPESQTSLRLTDVTGDVTHSISVRAHNDIGDSPWSNSVEIMHRLTPSVPKNVAVSVGEAGIVLSWEAPETGTADGYHVRYGEQDAESLETVNRAATETSYTHSDNVEGVTCAYRVRAHNAAGNGPWSDTVNAVRLLTPAAPTGVSARMSGSVITVSWTAPDSPVVDGYRVQYGVTGGEETSQASVPADATRFHHLDPVGDTEYEYRVSAVNSAGASPWSEPARAMRVIPPETPTSPSAGIDGEDLLFSWIQPDSGIIDLYHVDVRHYGHEDWTRTSMVAPASRHRHTGPQPGVTYQYRVRTVNAAGASGWTDTVSAVWYEGAAPPYYLDALNMGSQLLIRWNATDNSGATRYELRQQIDDGEPSHFLQSVNRTFRLVDWSRENDQEHRYAVRTHVGDQAGPWSATFRMEISQPAEVPNIRANREGATSTRLHWDEPASGAPHRYVIEARLDDAQQFHTLAYRPGTSTTYRADLQQHGHIYTYRVKARNHVGIDGEHSGDNVAVVAIPDRGYEEPGVPRDLDLSMANPTTAVLTWKHPDGQAGDVTSYRVYRKLASDNRLIGASYNAHVLAAFTGNNRTEFTDHTARPGVAYVYAVAAYRDGHEDPMGPISLPAYAQTW